MPLRVSDWSGLAVEHESGEVREPRIMVAVSTEQVTYSIKPAPDAPPVMLHSDDPAVIDFVRQMAEAVFAPARRSPNR